MSRAQLRILRRNEPLRLGFLPVIDCAPLVYAAETGLFERFGLDVQLQRETSWATVRDKVIYGDLDAAQVPGTLPFLANLGVESDLCACVSGLVLSLEGNGITISRRLWDQGVHDAETLRAQIHKVWRRRTYTFAVVSPFTSQEILLRRWLTSAGILPESELRIVTMPPEQMFPTLKLGYIDGCCVGEPWTTVAVQAGVGVCVATSTELAPLHPEKVLMVRQSFARGRAEEHERLVAALLEACACCETAPNRHLLGHLLAQPGYVNAPVECLGPTFDWLGGSVLPKAGSPQNCPRFYHPNANDPDDQKATWLIEGLYELLHSSIFSAGTLKRTPVLKNIFRRDVFERAKALRAEHARTELQQRYETAIAGKA